ncbi:MAG: ACT domain-containing protein [Bacteroidaceae bacterium]|nr:ACT domain-containing protein [Bacteroidaceae bacterium]
MPMKQLSIFIQNKRGTLLTVLDVLKTANIQIIASTISDTQDFGIYRIICSDPERAFDVLSGQGITVTLTDVFAIQLEDKPGEAARVLAIFAEADINIAYMYSFLLSGKGILVFRTNDTERTQQVIREKSLQLF